ncbi:hypothetical protein Tco_1376103 [Tanacetum coccineum]
MKPKEETFQVVLDALALTPCYPVFIITADVPEVYMHQFWNSVYMHDDFYRFKLDKKKRFKLTLEVCRDIFQIFPRVQVQDFDALPSEEDTLSFLRDLGHTGVINSLNDVVINQMHQPWRTFAALINRSLSGKTSGLDKLCLFRAQILWGMYHQKYVDYVELLWEDFTYQIDNKIGMHTSKDDYLINTLRFVSRKEASQIYGAVLPECLTSPEMKESKAYKTYLGYATGSVPPKIAMKFKKASPSKKDSVPIQADEEPVQKGKRVKRSAKKSSTTPAAGIVIRETPVKTKSKGKEKVDVSCGKVAEKPPSVEKIKHTVTSEGTGDKPEVLDVTKDDSTESESESWGNDEDDSNDENDSVSEGSEQENESDDDETQSNNDDKIEDEFIHTPSQSDDENDDEIEGDKDKGMDFDANKSANAPKETEVLATTSSQSSDLASKIIALEKEVVELKKDPLHTHVITLVDEHLTTRLGDTREEFMNFLSKSLMERINEQVKDQLPQILPKEVSNFAPPVIEKMIEESRNEVTLAKASSQPKSSYECSRKDKDKDEDPFIGSNRGLKKRKTSKDVDATTEEPEFEVADSDMPQDQEGNLGDNDDEPSKETASRRKTPQKGPTQKWLTTLAASSSSTDKSLKDFDELMSAPIDFSGYILNGLKIKNLTQEILLGPAFRLLKGTRMNYAELEYDFEECYKALSEKLDWENPKGGDYPFDLSKPLPLIMHGNCQRVPVEYFINNDLKYLQGGVSTMTYMTPVKVAYDKHALWGISHWREQQKTFYGYARGLQSRGDVYSTKHILAVTHVTVMRKHGYGYLEEIVMRRVDNDLYRFKEWDDVADFAIALRMFTRSLVIQKRVEDLQLGVKSYQKQINVTKTDTTRIDLRKRHPYTPYKDPQGFIYFDVDKKNSKNIDMEYLPKKMEYIGEKKSLLHDQGHQQAAKGKKDDEEFGEICWW